MGTPWRVRTRAVAVFWWALRPAHSQIFSIFWPVNVKADSSRERAVLHFFLLPIKCSFVYFSGFTLGNCTMSQLTRPEIEDLRERLRQLEYAHRPVRESTVSTDTPLDQLLPGKGLAAGTLIEWLDEQEGSGAATLALVVTAGLLQ